MWQPSFFQKYFGSCLLICAFLTLFSCIGVYWLDSNRPESTPSVSTIPAQRQESTQERPTPVPTVTYSHPFESGIVTPSWGSGAYGTTDRKWLTSLHSISLQTHSRWIELPVVFSQSNDSSLDLVATNATPETLEEGIRQAHAQGYEVFVVPNFEVKSPAEQWSGTISFQDESGIAAWFSHYEQLLLPYVKASAQAGAEQFSIGTELVWLQRNATNADWTHLIDLARMSYTGTLTYDTNWGELAIAPQGWMHLLDSIGVSEYIPLSFTPVQLSPDELSLRWKTIVQPQLDSYAEQAGKPLVLSEIGYRSDTVAGYACWDSHVLGSPDEHEQSDALNAAMGIIAKDTHITGTFWWGWQDVGAFTLMDTRAASDLGAWYSSSQL